MSILKTQKYLAAMSANELRKLDQIMELQKRDSLKRLYRAVKRNVKQLPELDKKRLYSKVFERPYETDMDYLLRNELRLLQEKINSLLVQIESEVLYTENTAHADFLYLTALVKHNLFNELESQFPKLYQAAIDAMDHYHAHKIAMLYFNYLMLHKEIGPQLLAEARGILQEDIKHLKYFYRDTVSINQHGQAANQAIMKQLQLPVDEVFIGPDKDFADISNEWIVFFEEASKTYHTTGFEKLQHAICAKNSLSKIPDHHPKVTLDSIAILAGAYYEQRDYVNAKTQYEEALDFCKQRDLQLRMDILFNYCSVLMKLKQYDNVLKIMNLYLEEIEANDKVKFRFEGFRCFCYIFQGDADSALSVIPTNPGQRPQTEYQYYRFIYTILPYLRKDYEDGLREANNFISYFNRKKEDLQFPIEKDLVLLFKNFYHILLSVPDKQSVRTQMTQIQTELQNFITANPFYTDFQYVTWLDEKLQHHASS